MDSWTILDSVFLVVIILLVTLVLMNTGPAMQYEIERNRAQSDKAYHLTGE